MMLRCLICFGLVAVAVGVAAEDKPALPFDPMLLLHDESVQNELEMLDDQYDDIRRFRSGILQARCRELQKDESLSERERASRLAKAVESVNEEVSKQLGEKLLLPHQVKRLKQCVWQSAASYDLLGTLQKAGVLNSSDLGELRKIYMTRRQLLFEVVQKHRADTEKMILQKLSADDRRKWQNLTGKPAKLQHSMPRPLSKKDQVALEASRKK